jgi:hypothetical protein
MTYIRIRLEHPLKGELHLEGGRTSFPTLPWRVRVFSGRGDYRCLLDEVRYSEEEAAVTYVDQFVKNFVQNDGYKITMFKHDGLDIDWLCGVGLSQT